MKKTKVLLCLCCLLAALLATACSGGKKPGRKLTVVSRAALEKVLEINELQSLEYIYNSYVIAYDDADKARMAALDAFFAAPRVTEENFEEAKTALLALVDAIPDVDADADDSSDAWLGTAATFIETYYDAAMPRLESLYNATTSDMARWNTMLKILPKVIDLFSHNDTISDTTYADYSENWKRLKDEYKEEKKKSYTYAVAYRGTVRAGIDQPIQFSVDDGASVVTVKIPQVKILDITVEPKEDTMRFLYKKSKYKKGNIKAVLQLCENDLRAKVADAPAFLELAEQNVIETIKALCAPFEKTSSYTFVVTGA